MAWSKFNSTIAYLGGKRRLVPEIFKHVPSFQKAPVFADAFMGSGVVSLFAKAKGYQVIGNDISDRSLMIGQALIENNGLKITTEDILGLFNGGGTKSRFVEEHYAGKVFTTQSAQFIDLARSRILEIENENKRALMALLLMKFCISLRPFGIFSAIKDISLLEERKIDEALSHKTNRNRTINQIKNPLPILERLAKHINNGVFYNGHENVVYKKDVREFIKDVQADVIYFDPPYADTASYEQTYKVLDSIITGEIIKPEVSVFTKHDALGFQDSLYKSSQHIKDWVISMGQTDPSTGIGPEELLAVVRKYKPNAEVRTLEHSWAIKNTSSKETDKMLEYIIYTHHE